MAKSIPGGVEIVNTLSTKNDGDYPLVKAESVGMNDGTTAEDNIKKKLDKNQGASNNGKFMKVEADGNLAPADVPIPDVSGQIDTHNKSATSHDDIRKEVAATKSHMTDPSAHTDIRTDVTQLKEALSELIVNGDNTSQTIKVIGEVVKGGNFDNRIDGGHWGWNGGWTPDANYITNRFDARDYEYNISVNATSLTMMYVFNGEPSTDTFIARYRNIDNNLPTAEKPYTVPVGYVVAFSNTKTSAYTVTANNVTGKKEFGNMLKEKFNAIDGKIPKSKYLRYVDEKGSDSSTERLEIYIPSNHGYIMYEFLHTVDDTINANCWRIGYAYSCKDDLTKNHALTTIGEWECAIHLKGRSDFSGGFAHGDETLNNIVFFVDGKKVNIIEYTNLTKFNSLSVCEDTNMYDPSDSSLLIAKHGREYIFDESVDVLQSLKWTTNAELTYCYMAMHLPSKAVTNKWYNDCEFIHSASYGATPNASKYVVYDENGSCKTEFEIINYPTGLTGGDVGLVTDNDGVAYNKCYFFVCGYGNTTYNVTKNTLWKSHARYKFEINTN